MIPGIRTLLQCICVLAIVSLNHCAHAQDALVFAKKRLLFTDQFSATAMDTGNWLAETLPAPQNNVYTRSGKLWLDTRDGVTVWYKKKLRGNYCIEYLRGIPIDTGANDRLSDLNTFWQATDPRNANLFTRKGVLASYDSLLLYYAGIGGNSNSTTRFRRYDGSGNRVLLQEYTDNAHLLQANKTYRITIIVLNGSTHLWVDGKPWFSLTGSPALPAGYFGLRSTKSRQWVDDVKIWEIE
jgi:rhamnogalacturonan endolyase